MNYNFQSRYGRSLFPVCFLLFVFILLFYPVLFEGNIFFFRDIKHFAYPMKLSIAQAWAVGEWPYWYPNLFQGMPLMSMMHPGVFYPPSIIFLLNDFNFAFGSYFLFHHMILMGSVYALCRYWGRSTPASLLAAVVSLLGGYFLSLAAIYNHFQSAVWFPLLLMMWQQFMVDRRIKYFFGAVIFLALQVLGGGPESAIFSVLLIYTHSLYLDNDEDRLQKFKQKTLALFVLVVFALALSALQWVPTYYLLKELVRGGGVNYIDSTLWSLAPMALLDLFLPENLTQFLEQEGSPMNYFMHSLYMGIIPLFFLLGCLLVGRKQKEIRFWLVVFGAGVFFALGRFNPLYSLFHEWVPLFNMFRFPEKFFFLCAYALVFLSAWALDRFVLAITSNKSETKNLLFALLVTAMVVAGIFGSFSDRAGFESLMILLLLAIGIVALHLKKINRTVFVSFLLLLMMMDLMGKNSTLAPMIDSRFYTEPSFLAKRLEGTADSFRIYSGRLLKKEEQAKAFSGSTEADSQNPFTQSKQSLYNKLSVQLAARDRVSHNMGTIYGIAYADGYSGMVLAISMPWFESFHPADIPKKKRILQRSNVKYWVTRDYEQPPSDQYPRGLLKLDVFENALPRAFLVGNSAQVQEKDLLNIYYDAAFNPLGQVLLTEPVEMKKAKNFSGEVEKIEYSPNRVSLKTNQNEEGFLVLLDTYFPGWKVEVDGKPEHIYRANYFYRGVKLSPGSHSIEFSYEPVGLKTGAAISGIATLLLLLLFFLPTKKFL